MTRWVLVACWFVVGGTLIAMSGYAAAAGDVFGWLYRIVGAAMIYGAIEFAIVGPYHGPMGRLMEWLL